MTADLISFDQHRARRIRGLALRTNGPWPIVQMLCQCFIEYPRAKTFPSEIATYPDDPRSIALEWDDQINPGTVEIILAEAACRRLGFTSGTHAVGSGGFSFGALELTQ